MNTTIDYYNEKAEKYFNDSFNITARDNQEMFISYLKEGDTILDFGCGSGRDTAWFIEKGYHAIPVDGSKNLAQLAEAYLQIPVKVMDFNDLDACDAYDGIYASASIMHLEYEALLDLFPKMIRALKENGIIYMSFKYGEEDGYLGKRYYTYMNSSRFQTMLASFPQLEIIMQETFGSEHPDLKDLRWFHAIVRKK